MWIADAIKLCDVSEDDILENFMWISMGIKGGISFETMWSMPMDRYLNLINKFNAFKKKAYPNG